MKALTKLKSLEQIIKISENQKKLGKKIALITGCFDVLHVGHVNMFRKTKEFADILIVGIENDQTIKLTKGKDRPINNQNTRSYFLSCLYSINYVFVVEEICDYALQNEKANQVYENILQQIKPHFLVTNKDTDLYWKKKQQRIKRLGGSFIHIPTPNPDVSTTKILEKLVAEL